MANPSAYETIADEIRDRIADGTYPPGYRLPSVRKLALAHGVSVTVSSRVYRMLLAQGIIESRAGSGYFVRTMPDVRRMARGRYTRRGSPFARDMAAAGSKPGWEAVSEVVEASPAVAARLDIDAGAEVVQTRYTYYADGKAVQRSTSWEPRAITGGTPVEIPEQGDYAGAGVIARMDTLGHHVREVTEEVVTRMPSPSETRELNIPAGVPVLVIERTHHADVPVETCDIVIPGDRYRLVYRVPVIED